MSIFLEVLMMILFGLYLCVLNICWNFLFLYEFFCIGLKFFKLFVSGKFFMVFSLLFVLVFCKLVVMLFILFCFCCIFWVKSWFLKDLVWILFGLNWCVLNFSWNFLFLDMFCWKGELMLKLFISWVLFILLG